MATDTEQEKEEEGKEEGVVVLMVELVGCVEGWGEKE